MMRSLVVCSVDDGKAFMKAQTHASSHDDAEGSDNGNGGDTQQKKGDGGDGIHHAVHAADTSRTQGSVSLRLRRHRAAAAPEDGVAVTK